MGLSPVIISLRTDFEVVCISRHRSMAALRFVRSVCRIYLKLEASVGLILDRYGNHFVPILDWSQGSVFYAFGVTM